MKKSTAHSKDRVQKKQLRDAQKHLEVQRDRERRKTRAWSWVSALLSILLGVAANVIASAPSVQNFILGQIYLIPIWGTVLLLPVVGIALFWVRSRFRWQYGVTEFLVGFAVAMNVFQPLHFDYSQLGFLTILQILGGAYIMVRGMDNIQIGIKGSKVEPRWKSVFRGPEG